MLELKKKLGQKFQNKKPFEEKGTFSQNKKLINSNYWKIV